MPTVMSDRLARSLYQRPREVARSPNSRLETVTYGREFFKDSPVFQRRAEFLSQRISSDATILVVGCGFGYLLEALLLEGLDRTWGIEPGPFFWEGHPEDWDETTRTRVARGWIGSGRERFALSEIGAPGNFDWVVDEDAAPAHHDGELGHFYFGLAKFVRRPHNIIHLVTADPDGVHITQNWKSLPDWEASAPDHTWADIRTIDVGP